MLNLAQMLVSTPPVTLQLARLEVKIHIGCQILKQTHTDSQSSSTHSSDMKECKKKTHTLS